LVGDEDDVPAAAAVAARRTAEGYELFAAERDGAVAAFPRHDVYIAGVDEFHEGASIDRTLIRG
jgi:hypothetical protein